MRKPGARPLRPGPRLQGAHPGPRLRPEAGPARHHDRVPDGKRRPDREAQGGFAGVRPTRRRAGGGGCARSGVRGPRVVAPDRLGPPVAGIRAAARGSQRPDRARGVRRACRARDPEAEGGRLQPRLPRPQGGRPRGARRPRHRALRRDRARGGGRGVARFHALDLRRGRPPVRPGRPPGPGAALLRRGRPETAPGPPRRPGLGAHEEEGQEGDAGDGGGSPRSLCRARRGARACLLGRHRVAEGVRGRLPLRIDGRSGSFAAMSASARRRWPCAPRSRR